MVDKFICVEVETKSSSAELILKVIGVRDGITYEEFVHEICKRCDVNCNPYKLKLQYKPRVIDRAVDDVPYFPLRDDYDLGMYFGVFDERGAGPILRVFLDHNSDVVEKDISLDPLLYVESNNFGIVNGQNDDDFNERVVMVDDTHFEDDLDAADVGEKGVDEKSVESGEAAEVGVLELDKLQAQLLALDNLDDGVINEGDNEANDDEVLKFNDDSDLCIGKIFDGKEEVVKYLKLIAMKAKFQFKTKKSNPSLVAVACAVEGCTWRVRLTKMGISNHFEVRTYVGEHTCGLKSASKGHRQASYDVIAELCMSRFDCGKGASPKEIQAFVQKELGYDVSYWRAWKARQAAMAKARGSPELGYAVLPGYFEALKRRNPGTVTAYELEKDQFKYCFIAYGATLHGFQFLRKVICVDGTFLSAKYGGVLLCASAEDGNGHIYPLAVGVVDSENHKSWKWFMEKLKECIPDNDELCFISDRHRSIIKAIAEVYIAAHHGCCTFHLWKNLTHNFKCYELQNTFERASRAYTITEFDTYFDIIKSANKKVWEYLAVDVGVQRWARAHFPGSRYNVLTTNIAQSLNSELKVERQWPIFALLRAIRVKLSKWFHTRRTNSSKNTKHVTPRCEKDVWERYKKSTCMVVDPLNDYEFNVRGIGFEHLVNLELKECSCKVFDIYRMPCEHAIAALNKVPGADMTEQIHGLCHRYYSNENWRKAYEMIIYPVPQITEWMTTEEIAAIKVLPPDVKVSKGRKKVKRIPSQGESSRRAKQRKRCSICRQTGHYQKRCPQRVPDEFAPTV